MQSAQCHCVCAVWLFIIVIVIIIIIIINVNILFGSPSLKGILKNSDFYTHTHREREKEKIWICRMKNFYLCSSRTRIKLWHVELLSVSLWLCDTETKKRIWQLGIDDESHSKMVEIAFSVIHWFSNRKMSIWKSIYTNCHCRNDSIIEKWWWKLMNESVVLFLFI